MSKEKKTRVKAEKQFAWEQATQEKKIGLLMKTVFSILSYFALSSSLYVYISMVEVVYNLWLSLKARDNTNKNLFQWKKKWATCHFTRRIMKILIKRTSGKHEWTKILKWQQQQQQKETKCIESRTSNPMKKRTQRRNVAASVKKKHTFPHFVVVLIHSRRLYHSMFKLMAMLSEYI